MEIQQKSSFHEAIARSQPRSPRSVAGPTRGGVDDLQTRLQLVEQYGDFSLAYSTAVQAGLEYFGDENGYIAFSRHWNFVFALGDPVAAPSQRPELILRFLNEHPSPCFIQISDETASVLQQERFLINEIGVDTEIDLPTYDFYGKSKEWLRYAANWISNRGMRVEERCFDDDLVAQTEAISDRWKETRTVKAREVRFLNRPIVYDDEWRVRKFFLFDRDHRVLAYVFFDPIHQDGQLKGYCTCIKRRCPAAPKYGEPAIMKYAIEQFKREGLELVTLGLSPMANIENKRFRRNFLLHFWFRYSFQAWWVNRYFYHLKGHAKYKRRFRGREQKFHYASPVILNDLRITALLRLMGLL